MPEEPANNLLPLLRTRHEYFDYLDRWTVGTISDLRAHMTTRALVKAYLLETSRVNGARDTVAALSAVSKSVGRLDETLYRLRWGDEAGDWALAEIEDERYVVLYTAMESKVANRRVEQVVEGSPFFDRAWFAAPMFERLWSVVCAAFPDHRFSRIVFEHESLYESFADDLHLPPSDEEHGNGRDEEDGIEVERRRARMQITERIGKLSRALKEMRREYDPLESIVQLRIPAPKRGGHDVYFNGKFTNRSDSIISLRQTVEMVTSIYRHSTERAEEAAWPQGTVEQAAEQPLSLGAPLLVKFSQSLEQATFDRWVASLRRKNNRFRLWGNPIEVGPGKVHVYAVDNHLWQPIDIEITRNHLYALLPSGTCGNTIHRLITNIQLFVDPKLKSYIGDQPYEDFIASAPANGAKRGFPNG